MRPSEVAAIVARALAEDLGDAGDITSSAVIPAGAAADARLVAREAGVVAGLGVAEDVFRQVDPAVDFRAAVEDGADIAAGTVLAHVAGPARGILTAERTALNFLGRMSGVATATRAFVEAVRGTGAQITDTRKTMPGLRALDKYAVTAGGGVNHRFGLYDAVMIKDNHIAAAGSIGHAVAAAREAVGGSTAIIVEVDDLEQLALVLESDVDRVLLDNMDTETLRMAVTIVDGRVSTEASGGVTLATVRGIAETGVDLISVGRVTHSPPQLDIGLDFGRGAHARPTTPTRTPDRHTR